MLVVTVDALMPAWAAFLAKLPTTAPVVYPFGIYLGHSSHIRFTRHVSLCLDAIDGRPTVLIEPGYEDPACSASAPAEDGTLYHCPECLPLEGLIALYPQVFADLDVVRVPYQRPRHDVVAIFGEENQGLPKLLLDDREFDGLRFCGASEFLGRRGAGRDREDALPAL